MRRIHVLFVLFAVLASACSSSDESVPLALFDDTTSTVVATTIPSTSSIFPLTHDAAGDAKYTTASAMSVLQSVLG